MNFWAVAQFSLHCSSSCLLLELELQLVTGFGDKMATDYRTNENKHVTVRVLIGCFFGALVIMTMVIGGVYSAHQNNIKDRLFTSECLKNGGEIRNTNSGLMCDK